MTQPSEHATPKWRVIDDQRVRQIWLCDTPGCPVSISGERTYWTPAASQASGVPMCSECNTELMYVQTEVLEA